MPRLRGGCLCGSVTFEIDGPIHSLQACHCSRCRKFYGAAFGPIAILDTGSFKYQSGDDFIATYRSSERVNRYFCRRCGSPLPILESWDPLVGVPAGLLDDDPGQLISEHIFVASKAPWHEILDTAPQHAAWPPGEDMDERYDDLTR